jgi:5-methylcytosine-specific restriction endonuclease McrA
VSDAEPTNDLHWCWACRTAKPTPAFAFRDIKRGVLQGHCRVCHARLRRAHYLKNKPDYIRRAIAQVKARRDENRRQLYRYLVTHPCVDCGEPDVVVLEFDHRVPANKVGEVGGLATTRRWLSVLKEIEKCDVRCVNCHRRKTAREYGWGGGGLV